MSIYLHDIPLPEAKERLQKALADIGCWDVLGKEIIPLNEDAVGRVLSNSIWAKISSPHYHSSAMDGFSVRSKDTVGASQTQPKTLIYGSEAQYVDTGDPLPAWANAVIMIENVEPLDQDGQPAEDPRKPTEIRIRSAVPPWHHVRLIGEDMVATQLILPSGHQIRPVDLGAVAGCGHELIKVARKPKVVIIPTGTELISIGETLEPGKIIEYNSLVLAAQINTWGGVAIRYQIVPDDFDLIREQVLKAAKDADLILLNAGSSAGSEDFSARVIESVGQLMVHGVAVRPGHPVIIGMVDRKVAAYKKDDSSNNDNDGSPRLQTPPQVPIIGVPGYPVSAALTGEIFIEPVISKWLGCSPNQPVEIEAVLTRKMTSPAGDDDYCRMVVGRVGERILASPLPKASGSISSLVRADGILVIPRGSQGYPSGEQVKVRLNRSREEIEKTIFATGSHDLTLDLIAQFLASKGLRLVSTNVGSIAGLVSIQRGETHLAGSHLLDPETGEYNLTYIQQYLPSVPVRVISLVKREQGLMVLQGNPKGINSLLDLIRDDIVYINRQRGSGTRVLLDYHLKKLKVDGIQIRGYDQEEYTHLGVAAAIASGRCDCGMGIQAATVGFGLDFIPMYQERYDLVIPLEFADTELLTPLYEVLKDKNFQRIVADMPGYNIETMGKVVAESE
jgi:putative molybdopterin biosynthesis protein